MTDADPAALLMIERQVALLVEKAMAFGAACERARIAAIMHAPLASENLALAWTLALENTVSLQDAETVLRIAHLANAPLPTGAAGEPLAN